MQILFINRLFVIYAYQFSSTAFVVVSFPDPPRKVEEGLVF